MDVLSQSNISIYPVDVRGLVNDVRAAEPAAEFTMPRNRRPNDAIKASRTVVG